MSWGCLPGLSGGLDRMYSRMTSRASRRTLSFIFSTCLSRYFLALEMMGQYSCWKLFCATKPLQITLSVRLKLDSLCFEKDFLLVLTKQNERKTIGKLLTHVYGKNLINDEWMKLTWYRPWASRRASSRTRGASGCTQPFRLVVDCSGIILKVRSWVRTYHTQE